jgi:hypothetical protein
MSNLQIFVTLAGSVLTILSTWYSWFASKVHIRSGAQEAAITVKGGILHGKLIVE